MSRWRGFEHDSKGVNRHHKIAKSEWGSNHPDNIELMEVIKHRALHILFLNDKPIEQLQTSLNINTSVLIQDCRKEIETVLEFWKNQGREAYNPNVLKWRH